MGLLRSSLLLTIVAACSADSVSEEVAPAAAAEVGYDASTPDQGALAPDLGSRDAGLHNDAEEIDRFAEARRVLNDAVASGNLRGFGFAVMTEAPLPVWTYAAGDYALAQTLPLDSCSKPITALTVLRLVENGQLTLTDTLGDHLGWRGPEAQITLAQLMAFTSGFSGNARCLSPPAILRADGTLFERDNRTTLAACAEEIRQGGLVDPPGTVLRYGGSHQNVLAHVVEVVTGQTWDEVFENEVQRPLGLVGAIRYASNRVAGAAVSTAPAVARIFQQIGMDAGHIPPQGTQLLSSSLARQFLQNQTPDPVTRLDSPWTSLGLDTPLGLGIWIDCRGDDCIYLGSGANGSTAWIDPDGGYAAALVAYQRDFRGYRDTYGVVRQLIPQLRAALE